MLKYLFPLLTIHLFIGSCASTTGERWRFTEGKVKGSKSQVFAENKRQCKSRVSEAKLAGLDHVTARLAYYHCMERKGWQLKE